uniref:DDE Tnp4 domain-containing protein n=1 Tax=Cyprinus carpio carpio TaxID=630221 RepID=A0A9J7XNE0_CYPCA
MLSINSVVCLIKFTSRFAFGVALLCLRRRRRRSVWVHDILQARQQLGEYHRLVQELRLDDGRFQRYFRLDRDQFDNLLSKVGPRIVRQDTSYLRTIELAEHLAICLQFLATGDSFRTIAFSYRVGVSTVAGIVGEVARAIWDALVRCTEDWRSIATDFLHRWNFPNCLGSIDGKHVVIKAPDNSGSLFFNYKGTYSVVFLAVVDAQCCFRVVDVGSYGRTSDGGALANSTFGQVLRGGTHVLPQDALLPSAEHLGPQPHGFVADEAFPLRRDLMRPFPGHNLSSRQRIFNYRLSRARLIVENTFGILTAQWRMCGVIEISPANVDVCVKATCVLHNFLRRSTNSTRTSIPSAGHGEAAGLQETRVGSNNPTWEAIRVWEKLMTYFSTEGAVPWQPVA